jgi:hypothetical protein
MNTQTHSLADWVRLRGGIKISESTRDNTEIRHYCSRGQAGYNLLNAKTGRTLDELANDAICEGWLSYNSDHSDFLELLGKDIQAKRTGDMWARAWHPTRDWDDLIAVTDEELDLLFEDWDFFCGDCCSSCGNPEATLLYFGPQWQDMLCDDCTDMLESVCREEGLWLS